MLNEQTIEKLYAMKLNGMAETFKEQLQQPPMDELCFEERFGLLVDRQWTWKENRRMRRLLQNARLKINACLEDIDYKSPRGIDKSVILRLATCDWIKSAQNIIITGPTGVGKTFVCCALANSACRSGYPSLYTRAPRLFQELATARADGSYAKLLARLAKTDVLLLDDWGLSKLNAEQRRDLLEILEDRYGSRATIITSQLPLDQWHDIIGDATLADAIMDRLIHNAYKINLTGKSMRKKQAKLTVNN